MQDIEYGGTRHLSKNVDDMDALSAPLTLSISGAGGFPLGRRRAKLAKTMPRGKLGIRLLGKFSSEVRA